MDIWLVTADCGDYYCEGEHLVGVATSFAEAERIRGEAERATTPRLPKYGGEFKRWDRVFALDKPVQLDTYIGE